jgi:hypothetical protein
LRTVEITRTSTHFISQWTGENDYDSEKKKDGSFFFLTLRV